MAKSEVEKRLDKLEEYVSDEMDAIRRLASKETINLFSIKTYKDLCKALNENEETCPYKKIKQLQKLFNGTWKVNIKDPTQEKYYPYFNITGSGFVFHDSNCNLAYCAGPVAYYKDRETSNHIGTYFKDIYQELYS